MAIEDEVPASVFFKAMVLFRIVLIWPGLIKVDFSFNPKKILE